MNLHDSSYIYMANQTVEWLPMDTEERYIRNAGLKETRLKLEQNNWIDAKFTYSFNSYGFRCQEFTNEPNAVFLGSSKTTGIGLPLESTWPVIVSNHLNLKCYNLSTGGTSNDTVFRLAEHWLERLNPTIVFWYTSPQDRFDIWYNSDSHTVTPIWPTELPLTDYFKIYTSNNYNAEINYRKNIRAVKNICHELGVKLVLIDEQKTPIEYIDLARDLAHPGVKANAQFANFVLQQT